MDGAAQANDGQGGRNGSQHSMQDVSMGALCVASSPLPAVKRLLEAAPQSPAKACMLTDGRRRPVMPVQLLELTKGLSPAHQGQVLASVFQDVLKVYGIAASAAAASTVQSDAGFQRLRAICNEAGAATAFAEVAASRPKAEGICQDVLHQVAYLLLPRNCVISEIPAAGLLCTCSTNYNLSVDVFATQHGEQLLLWVIVQQCVSIPDSSAQHQLHLHSVRFLLGLLMLLFGDVPEYVMWSELADVVTTLRALQGDLRCSSDTEEPGQQQQQAGDQPDVGEAADATTISFSQLLKPKPWDVQDALTTLGGTTPAVRSKGWNKELAALGNKNISIMGSGVQELSRRLHCWFVLQLPAGVSFSGFIPGQLTCGPRAMRTKDQPLTLQVTSVAAPSHTDEQGEYALPSSTVLLLQTWSQDSLRVIKLADMHAFEQATRAAVLGSLAIFYGGEPTPVFHADSAKHAFNQLKAREKPAAAAAPAASYGVRAAARAFGEMMRLADNQLSAAGQ